MPQNLPDTAYTAPTHPSDSPSHSPFVVPVPVAASPPLMSEEHSTTPHPSIAVSNGEVAAADAPPPTTFSPVQPPSGPLSASPNLVPPSANIIQPTTTTDTPPLDVTPQMSGGNFDIATDSSNDLPDDTNDLTNLDNVYNDSGDEFPHFSRVVDAIRRNLLGPRAAEFTDCVLLCADNVKVPICRSLLAARSLYFKNLFYLPFQESRETVVTVAINSNSLNEVLHSVYTDVCPLLESIKTAIAVAKKESNNMAKVRPGNPSNNLSLRALNGSCATTDSGLGTLFGANAAILAARTSSTMRSYLDDSLNASVLGKRRQPEPVDHVVLVNNAVELVYAADYLQLPGLSKKAASLVIELTSAVPHTVCPAFQAVLHQPSLPTLERVDYHLRALIRRHPYGCLGIPDIRACLSKTASSSISEGPEFPHAIAQLTEKTLEIILKDSDVFTSETYLFEFLFYWLTGSLISSVRGASKLQIEEWKGSLKWPAAKRLAEHIDLERVKPSFIQDYILPLGIIDSDRLFNTFLQQALQSERGRPLFDNFRGGSCWPNEKKRMRSNSPITKMVALNGPRMESGRHEWIFRIVKNSPTFLIGIVKEGVKVEKGLIHLFDGDRGWAYSTSGKIFPLSGTDFARAKAPPGPKLMDGDTVRVILNLTKSGTLTIIARDDPKSFPAFREMRSKASSFSLVVALTRPGEIELLSEKHHLT